jgi:hypothetical protein
MRRTFTLSLAATAALVAGGAAHAQDAPRGDMTRAQAEQHSAEMFGRMDVNADGVLDEADREAARRRAFDALDADRDGALSFAEFEAQRDGHPVTSAERRGPDTRGFARRGMRGFGRGEIAGVADADGDGAVSQAEFASAALARFDSADADRDGTISLEERRESRHQMRHDKRRGRPGRDDG